MNIWFATNNVHKKKELEAILGTDLKIPAREGYDFCPKEDADTFRENALIKARELQKLLGRDEPVIADDSGLCVDALGGRPGVLSARYGMENGNKLTSAQQNIMLLDELLEAPKRSARFVCAMVLLLSNDRFFIIQETLEGEIVKKSEMRGEGGFGYDPIFLVPEYGRTLAELSADEKNFLSHRGKAGKIIAKLLKDNV
ncbi:MAG: RdgB/HAM1 family non-canonical purine NTP pyrophosphatase [Treponema sp.]|jgi:XTP/dITP diphosphohydrolase|nr:RdgB/HAM1 family non-canonical purine NTP pyrophosphatase [Treponema sp.]